MAAGDSRVRNRPQEVPSVAPSEDGVFHLHLISRSAALIGLLGDRGGRNQSTATCAVPLPRR